VFRYFKYQRQNIERIINQREVVDTATLPTVRVTKRTNESPSSLGERSKARKTIRVAWGKVLEWVTKASLLSFRESFGSSAPPIIAKIRERGCDLPRGEGGPGFESPSEFGVLACTHLLHRGPSPAQIFF
jgi:hypothetical protein